MEADMRSLFRALALTGSIVALGAALPAQAGGDDYDATADVQGRGPAYFGFVRDSRGSPVRDARVVLQPKSGDSVVLKSNALGLYRSHISKEVSPDEVQISCDKDGYKQTRVQRRNPPGAKDMHIETNCTLQRL
jgi:hypothetical protein